MFPTVSSLDLSIINRSLDLAGFPPVLRVRFYPGQDASDHLVRGFVLSDPHGDGGFDADLCRDWYHFKFTLVDGVLASLAGFPEIAEDYDHFYGGPELTCRCADFAFTGDCECAK